MYATSDYLATAFPATLAERRNLTGLQIILAAVLHSASLAGRLQRMVFHSFLCVVSDCAVLDYVVGAAICVCKCTSCQSVLRDHHLRFEKPNAFC